MGKRAAPDALKLPHLKLFTQSVNDTLISDGKTADVYFQEVLASQDAQRKFFQWIENTFRADPLVSYATAYDLVKDARAIYLRPWRLPLRADYGLRGTGDWEVQLHLAQLMVLNRMETNPNNRVSRNCEICECQLGWLQSGPGSLRSNEFLDEKLPCCLLVGPLW